MFSKRISISSPEEILILVNLASLLEISGWPKPGNVHRTHNFRETRYEHFLAGIASIQPSFRHLCFNLYKNYDPKEKNFKIVNLGEFYLAAAKKMMQYQAGGNVLLGHILILGPLCAAATICLKRAELDFENFQITLREIIEKSDVKDTELLYRAIITCNPGGLGEVQKYDLNDKNSIQQIHQDNVNLKKIFDLSKNGDLISSEYSTGFQIILNESLPFFFSEYEREKDINKTTVNTFLKILSEHPDTLIIRKSGKSKAKIISEKAKKVIEKGGMSTLEGIELIKNLDDELKMENGKLNPGTTADLLAGVIFCALLFGLRF